MYFFSTNENVTTVTETSNTASLDFSTGNFFKITIDDNTHISASNIEPGQTILVEVGISNSSPTASFSTNILQPSGSGYTPTPNSGSKDVLTFTTFNSTETLLVAVNKFE